MGKCELDSLLYDLKHYDSPDFFDDLDSIWIQILDDISQYSELMDHLHFVECVPICPLISFERPDVLYCDNKSEWVMGIECFQFDASKKTRKGSRQRIEEKKTRDDILKEHQLNLNSRKKTDDYIAIRKNVDVDLSFEYYYNSLLDSFIKHAKRISEYRNNIEKSYPGRKVYLTFFIEDITAIGNYVSNQGKTEVLTPLRIQRFLNVLKQIKGLDYIAVKTIDSYVPQIQILNCSDESIDKMMEYCYANESKYISYNYAIESHFHGMRE